MAGIKESEGTAGRDELGKQSRVQIMKGLINHDEGWNFILKAMESHRGILTMMRFTFQKAHSGCMVELGEGD